MYNRQNLIIWVKKRTNKNWYFALVLIETRYICAIIF